MSTAHTHSPEAIKVCIVMPGFNEAKHIGPVVRDAAAFAPVVVVDDGSADQTADVAEKAGAIVLKHAVNKGKGAALATGFDYATSHGYDAVITMDSDGQHDPREIPNFIKAFIDSGAPVVVGNRMHDLKHMPLVRKLTNKIMSGMLSRRMGQFVPDTQCGFRLYQCAILSQMSSDSQRFAAESEVLLNLSRQGIRIESIPVRTIYGDECSKINPIADTIRFFRMLRRYKKIPPLNFPGQTG